MNERIIEIALQAGIVKILEEHAHEYGNGTFDNTSYPELERFAELIVKKCLGIIRLNDDETYGEGDIRARSILRQVKEHFGVE